MVYLNYIPTTAGITKIGTLVIGVIVLGVACHSHFQSKWSSNYTQICEGISCVSIVQETFLVGLSIFAFVFSLLHLIIVVIFKEATEHVFRIIDYVYHFVIGVLLIIAASLFINSAVKIESLPGDEILQFYEEKIVCGVGALLLALLYIGAGVLVFLTKDSGRITESEA